MNSASSSFSKANAPKRRETWRECDWIRIGFLSQITQSLFSNKVCGLRPHFSPVVFSVLEELALNNTSPFSVAMQLEEMALLCLDTSFQPSFSSVRIFSLYLLSEVLAGKFCSGSTCPRFPLQCTVCFEKSPQTSCIPFAFFFVSVRGPDPPFGLTSAPVLSATRFFGRFR